MKLNRILHDLIDKHLSQNSRPNPSKNNSCKGADYLQIHFCCCGRPVRNQIFRLRRP